MSKTNPQAEAVANLRNRIQRLDNDGLDLIFREARSFKKWQDREEESSVLHELYDIMMWGPTSQNSNPGRIVFLKREDAKNRAIPALHEGNIPKVKPSPVLAIVAYDTQFFEYLPQLFPAKDTSPLYRANPAKAESTAFRNSSLQGAYFIIAARALGLDCGSISGFKNAMVDELFFAGTPVKSNFISNIGYGNHSKVYRKFNRFDFDDVCEIL